MADSIHDQWTAATAEWARMAAAFDAAWIVVDANTGVSPQDAAFAAAISYLGRLLMDATVMAGDMITVIASTGANADAGLIQNLQHLQQTVLPQWGYLAAAYTSTQVYAAVNAEQSARQLAIARAVQQLTVALDTVTQAIAGQVSAESQARAAGDTAVLQQVVSLVNAEAQARVAGDQQVLAEAVSLVNAEAQARVAADKQVLAYVQTLPGLIDTRAASGYDPTLRARGTLVTKLLDTVTAHDPAVSQLVSKLAGWLVDLAGVEDPVLRVAAGLVLKQVIDRLGVSTALHTMLGDLITSIIGSGPPKTLQQVTADIGSRLDNLESSVSALAPLAPEADQLHEMGTLIFDGLLLAYFTAAVVSPVATADDTVSVFAPVVDPLLAPVRAMLGMLPCPH